MNATGGSGSTRSRAASAPRRRTDDRDRRRSPAPRDPCAAGAGLPRLAREPALLERWFAAGSFSVARVEVDERVGGRHRTWRADPAGGFEAEILELVLASRIVFR